MYRVQAWRNYWDGPYVFGPFRFLFTAKTRAWWFAFVNSHGTAVVYKKQAKEQ